MMKRPVYRNYNEGRQFTNDPELNPIEDYKQRLERMLNINSDIRLTKFLPGIAGAYSSNSQYIDFFDKTYENYNFNYESEFPNMTWIDKYKTISSKFMIDSEKMRISELPNSYTNRISINKGSFSNQNNYHYPAFTYNINKTICYEEQFDSLSHEVKIHGDPTIISGKKLNLRFEKPIDPSLIKQGFINTKDEEKDAFISGNYVITSVNHMFDTDYFIEFRAKKDSYSVNIEE
jgi:hypothetical protein